MTAEAAQKIVAVIDLSFSPFVAIARTLSFF